MEGDTEHLEPMIINNLEYWNEVVKHLGKKKSQEYFVNRMKQQNGKFEIYTRTSYENHLKDFNNKMYETRTQETN